MFLSKGMGCGTVHISPRSGLGTIWTVILQSAKCLSKTRELGRGQGPPIGMSLSPVSSPLPWVGRRGRRSNRRSSGVGVPLPKSKGGTVQSPGIRGQLLDVVSPAHSFVASKHAAVCLVQIVELGVVGGYKI